MAKGVKLTYRQQVAQQDHSPVWVERSGGQWVDEGLDTPCRLAPAALINLWKIGVRCRSRRGPGHRVRGGRAAWTQGRSLDTLAALSAQLVEHFHGKEGVNR